MIKIRTLLQKYIGSVSDQIQIIVDLDLSKHASDRQWRHGVDDFIQDKQIKKAIDDAVSQIAKALIFDEFNIGQSIIVVNEKFSPPLNIVGVLQRRSDKLVYKIITLMRKKNFKVKSGTHELIIK